MSGRGARAFFFDRDGIVNRSPGAGYVERWEDFRLEPGFVEALRLASDAGYLSIVVTNQRGIALGLLERTVVDDMHKRLRALLEKEHGLTLTDIVVCPHDVGECECRKPKPGMLTDAAARYGIDLAASWMIGDMESDMQAGRAAGCRTIRVGGGAPTARSSDGWVATACELPSAVRWALAQQWLRPERQVGDDRVSTLSI